jgi:hypothetical protein
MFEKTRTWLDSFHFIFKLFGMINEIIDISYHTVIQFVNQAADTIVFSFYVYIHGNKIMYNLHNTDRHMSGYGMMAHSNILHLK